jgi:hypothetical protein
LPEVFDVVLLGVLPHPVRRADLLVLEARAEPAALASRELTSIHLLNEDPFDGRARPEVPHQLIPERHGLFGRDMRQAEAVVGDLSPLIEAGLTVDHYFSCHFINILLKISAIAQFSAHLF